MIKISSIIKALLLLVITFAPKAFGSDPNFQTLTNAFGQVLNSPDALAGLQMAPLYTGLFNKNNNRPGLPVEFVIYAGFKSPDEQHVYQYWWDVKSKKIIQISVYPIHQFTPPTNPFDAPGDSLHSGNLAAFQAALPKFREWTAKALETQPAPFEKVLPVQNMPKSTGEKIEWLSMAGFSWGDAGGGTNRATLAITLSYPGPGTSRNSYYSPEQADAYDSAIKLQDRASEYFQKLRELWLQKALDSALEIENNFN